MAPPSQSEALDAAEVAPQLQAKARSLEDEVINLFVEIAQMLGQPKSVGQIYGLLYISPGSLSMEDIQSRLGISLGSVSQGLRQLRAYKAIRLVFRAGQRRDFFEAETELKRLVTGFIQEQIGPQGERTRARLEALRPMLEEIEPDPGHYSRRIDKVASWQKRSQKLFSGVSRLMSGKGEKD